MCIRDRSSRLPTHQRGRVLLKLVADAACGLDYLSRQCVTHGDVSASSVLVVTLPGGAAALTAKICHLGLASPWCCCSSQHRHGIADCPAAEPSAVWPRRAAAAPELLVHGVAAVSEASDVWQFGVVLHQINDVVGRHPHLVAIATDCCGDCPAHRPRFADVHRRLLLAASATSDPAADPVIDRVTGEVIWACDLHTGSPAASNETGYSLLSALPTDLTTYYPRTDDDCLVGQHPQPCRHDNGERARMISDENGQDGHRHLTLPRSLSSHTSEHVIL